MAEPTVIGLFHGPDQLLAAVRRLRGQGIEPLDACSPYPVHGLAQALGLRESPLGGMVMVMAVLGALCALGLQYWVSAVDYPIITGGKAPGSWEAFVPVMFELAVLFGAFTAGLGMLVLLAGLPRYDHALLGARSMAAISHDRFALVLAGPEAAAALRAAGAEAVEELPGPVDGKLTSRAVLAALAGIAGACLLAGTGTWLAVRALPELPPMVHMQRQPRLDAQAPSRFFADGAGMRAPAPGTVARGCLPEAAATEAEAAALVNPLPRTPAVMAQGRLAYQQRCALCHGPLGDGRHCLGPNYGASPANLQSADLRAAADGRIYRVIVHGKNAMPGHEADLDEDQRWAVVHYLRALQRAQHAKASDLAEAPP